MKEKFNKIINMDKKLKLSIVILLLWLCLNIYVTYFQEKILIVGDWPHEYFKDDYWNPLKKYSWSPSLGFLELSCQLDDYYQFDKVYVVGIDKNILKSGKIDILNHLYNKSNEVTI